MVERLVPKLEMNLDKLWAIRKDKMMDVMLDVMLDEMLESKLENLMVHLLDKSKIHLLGHQLVLKSALLMVCLLVSQLDL
jgi:hypothetical protein